MKAAIYSRKSKYTGKGESVENQIQLCKEYGIKNLGIDEKNFIIYEDEGFSGSNTKRPEFQKMLNDIKRKKIDTIICYRLDRISRNVLDFLNLIEILNKENITFVSIREQFDTTTPIGRAMMYIASVFAQLERETIAERIRDNMLQLAKSGRWLGGNLPTGFKSQPIITKDSGGKEKKEYKLIPIQKEVNIVKEIYNKFLQFKSLSSVESYLIKNNIKTKKGMNFNRHSIKLILKNPVYAVADKNVLEYLKQEGYCICSEPNEFNGINGLISYNKTKQTPEKKIVAYNDIDQWIIAVGKHEGIITGKDWVEVQKLLLQNKSKAYRRERSTTALLSGILKCKNCGSFMRPKSMKRYDSNGQKIFYYICEKKEKSKRSSCLSKNLNGNKLDSQVQESIKEIMKSLNIAFIKPELWDSIDINIKRVFIKQIIPQILWDGEKIDIILFDNMFPQRYNSK
ncbi:recombinase family protein [Lutispora thermophila]|uniref:Site-specific DNA recombinase n=1 Tax=Lutispora thermophila DSM 19022 TaxID=1122184 RepID=A0A1M6F323_9FIRM|nr:recombinase family protein [Lutispora thermophila]SHI92097.1 site-specific DNA recombinase [Lutispora thermophila DSM 19022]